MKTQFRSNAPLRISPRLVLGFMVALVVFFLLLTSVVGLAEKHGALKREIKNLETKQSDLKQKELALTRTNEYLQTPEGKEQVFRAKYNVVKPGEGMILITADPKLPPPPPPQSAVSRLWDSILHGLGIGTD